jgi:hypothetical protein
MLERAGQMERKYKDEFLAARDLKRDENSHRATLALKDLFTGNDWWRGVMQFYFGLWGKPDEIHHWILVKAFDYRPVSKLRLDSIYNDFLEVFPHFLGVADLDD